MKPRIVRSPVCGWFCYWPGGMYKIGYAGKTPAEAYNAWAAGRRALPQSLGPR